MHFVLAAIDASGNFQWANGNIPGAYPENDHVLTYGSSYSAMGWVIRSSPAGTTFTNSGTQRGMFVSIENVSTF